MTMTPEEAEERVEALCDPSDELLGVTVAGESQAATYALAVVLRDHPEDPDARVLMERYAQLPEEWSDMNDTFMKNGVNRRVEGSGAELAQSLAQTYAGVAAHLRADNPGERETARFDAREGQE